VCEHVQRSPNPCGFRTARTILEQPVTRDQMARLLAQGRSDLLPGFVSRKSGRGFRACLVLDGSGQVSFEFPPREAAEAGG
jgi:DNA topoisomerase-3